MEETDYLLFTFVLKKPYFQIFHANYQIFLLTSAVAHLGCHQENKLKSLYFYYKIMKKPYMRTI